MSAATPTLAYDDLPPGSRILREELPDGGLRLTLRGEGFCAVFKWMLWMFPLLFAPIVYHIVILQPRLTASTGWRPPFPWGLLAMPPLGLLAWAVPAWLLGGLWGRIVLDGERLQLVLGNRIWKTVHEWPRDHVQDVRLEGPFGALIIRGANRKVLGRVPRVSFNERSWIASTLRRRLCLPRS